MLSLLGREKKWFEITNAIAKSGCYTTQQHLVYVNNLCVYDILSMFSIHYVLFFLVFPCFFSYPSPKSEFNCCCRNRKILSLDIEMELHFLVIGLEKLLLWYINFDCIQQQQDEICSRYANMKIGKCLFIAAGQLYGRLLCQHKWFCVKMYTLLMDILSRTISQSPKIIIKRLDFAIWFMVWFSIASQFHVFPNTRQLCNIYEWKSEETEHYSQFNNI